MFDQPLWKPPPLIFSLAQPPLLPSSVLIFPQQTTIRHDLSNLLHIFTPVRPDLPANATILHDYPDSPRKPASRADLIHFCCISVLEIVEIIVERIKNEGPTYLKVNMVCT